MYGDFQLYPVQTRVIPRGSLRSSTTPGWPWARTPIGRGRWRHVGGNNGHSGPGPHTRNIERTSPHRCRRRASVRSLGNHRRSCPSTGGRRLSSSAAVGPSPSSSAPAAVPAAPGTTSAAVAELAGPGSPTPAVAAVPAAASGGCPTARARHARVLVRRVRGRRPARSTLRPASPTGRAPSSAPRLWRQAESSRRSRRGLRRRWPSSPVFAPSWQRPWRTSPRAGRPAPRGARRSAPLSPWLRLCCWPRSPRRRPANPQRSAAVASLRPSLSQDAIRV